jgi:FkbM family methyltransferase
MRFLHRTRLFVNDLLSPFGLAINRIEKQPVKWFRTILTIQVGRYFIRIPSQSPLSRVYGRHPEPLGPLGRLTTLVKKKFCSLAVIDVGANVGDTACIIKTAEDVPVLCIEGDEYIFDFLEKNIAQFQNVTTRKLFLGETTRVIRASFEKSGWNLTVRPNETSRQVVNLISLDDFIFAEPEWQTFRLLKIDAEGFDCSILRGATNFLREVHPVVHFEYNRENMDPIGEPGIDTLLLLSALGYSHLTFHDPWGRFFCSTSFLEKNFIEDLHGYADSIYGKIPYYDITAFHESDSDLATKFTEIERREREDKPVGVRSAA